MPELNEIVQATAEKDQENDTQVNLTILPSVVTIEIDGDNKFFSKSWHQQSFTLTQTKGSEKIAVNSLTIKDGSNSYQNVTLTNSGSYTYTTASIEVPYKAFGANASNTTVNNGTLIFEAKDTDGATYTKEVPYVTSTEKQTKATATALLGENNLSWLTELAENASTEPLISAVRNPTDNSITGFNIDGDSIRFGSYSGLNGMMSYINQYSNEITFGVQSVQGLNEELQTISATAGDAYNTATSASSTAASAYSRATTVNSRFSTFTTSLLGTIFSSGNIYDNGMIDSTSTLIDGGHIYTDTLSLNKLIIGSSSTREGEWTQSLHNSSSSMLSGYTGLKITHTNAAGTGSIVFNISPQDTQITSYSNESIPYFMIRASNHSDKSSYNMGTLYIYKRYTTSSNAKFVGRRLKNDGWGKAPNVIFSAGAGTGGVVGKGDGDFGDDTGDNEAGIFNFI